VGNGPSSAIQVLGAMVPSGPMLTAMNPSGCCTITSRLPGEPRKAVKVFSTPLLSSTKKKLRCRTPGHAGAIAAPAALGIEAQRAGRVTPPGKQEKPFPNIGISYETAEGAVVTRLAAACWKRRRRGALVEVRPHRDVAVDGQACKRLGRCTRRPSPRRRSPRRLPGKERPPSRSSRRWCSCPAVDGRLRRADVALRPGRSARR